MDAKRANKQKDIPYVIIVTRLTIQTRNRRETNDPANSHTSDLEIGRTRLYRIIESYMAVRLVMVIWSIHADAEHELSRRRRPGHRRRRVYIEFIGWGPRSLINLSTGKLRSTEKRRRRRPRGKIHRTFPTRRK